MHERVIVQHQFINITQGLQEDILKRVDSYFQNWSDTYLKRYFVKKDAEIKIVIHMEKNKQEKYEATFSFYLDSDTPILYHNENPFKEPIDLVNHAFLHLKEYLAENKD